MKIATTRQFRLFLAFPFSFRPPAFPCSNPARSPRRKNCFSVVRSAAALNVNKREVLRRSDNNAIRPRGQILSRTETAALSHWTARLIRHKWCETCLKTERCDPVLFPACYRPACAAPAWLERRTRSSLGQYNAGIMITGQVVRAHSPS